MLRWFHSDHDISCESCWIQLYILFPAVFVFNCFQFVFCCSSDNCLTVCLDMYTCDRLWSWERVMIRASSMAQAKGTFVQSRVRADAKNIQQLFHFTLQRTMNATWNYRKCSRVTRHNSEWDSVISRTGMFRKGKHLDVHLESSRQDPKISEIQTLQHSVKDPSNGICAWKNWQGNQLGLRTRTCTQLQFRILRIDTSFQTESREKWFFTSCENFERERIHCGLGSFTSYCE